MAANAAAPRKAVHLHVDENEVKPLGWLHPVQGPRLSADHLHVEVTEPLWLQLVQAPKRSAAASAALEVCPKRVGSLGTTKAVPGLLAASTKSAMLDTKNQQ